MLLNHFPVAVWIEIKTNSLYERRDLFGTKTAVPEFSTNFGDCSWFLLVIQRSLTPFYRNRALINPLLLNEKGRSCNFIRILIILPVFDGFPWFVDGFGGLLNVCLSQSV